MASSVAARMPSEEWLPRLHIHKALPKVLTRISQSQILDRWAARQAREAELSALLSTAQPVSARAASFLRETSPDQSPVAAAGAAGVGIPASARASSLIQMWREMEAEAGVCPPTPRAERRKGMVSLRENEAPAKERGRREMEEGFVLKMLLEERRREVAALAEGRPVSRFPFRGRIQSLIRLRSLRQEVATIRHLQWSQKLEAKRFETGSKNFFLRERPEDGRQHDINEVPTEESMVVMEVQPSDSPVSVFAIPTDQSDGENNHFSELDSTREIESSSQAFYTPQTFFTPLSQDLQESQSSDASWDERSLWGSGLDWQRPSDSHIVQTLHEEVAFEGTERSTLEQHVVSTECNRLLQPSNPWRGWGVIGTFSNDLLNTNFVENGEIQELLEMKTVSTSLASEFSTKMNQMITSFLHRQGLHYGETNGREECEEQCFWRQNYESSYDQKAADATSLTQLSSAMLHNQESWQNTSLSLSSQILQNQESWQSISLPLPSQMLQRQKSWQSSSFTQNSSPSVLEEEDIHDLKNSVGQIHHEISELRKLVQSCLDWQKKLSHSIKQEVISAVNQLAGRGNLLHNSKCMQGRTDTCCICCEAQVDTLLYRCGHMCACYKCAQELQWSSGRCPICRSLIADVIRAYPKS